MKRTTTKKQDAASELINKCSVYLNENFHKFSQSNKIKIALEIFKKKMPERLEGNFNVTLMPDVKIGGKTLELNIG